MKPLINWEALESLNRSPNASGRPDHNWDLSADMYNMMAEMERSYTDAYLDCFDTAPTDTVLDIGCGPGRISCLMAKRAKSVTSLDAYPRMLEYCTNNAAAQELQNVQPTLLDWHEVKIGEPLAPHDIVIASRSVGLYDIRKLNQFAKKWAVMIAWANDDSIPHILYEMFEGTRPNEPAFAEFVRDRRAGYNIVWNKVYDMGADPNIRIVKDGFTKTFPDRQTAIAWLRKLRPFEDAYLSVFEKNLEPMLTTEVDGSVTFRRETTSFVLWWKPINLSDENCEVGADDHKS